MLTPYQKRLSRGLYACRRQRLHAERGSAVARAYESWAGMRYRCSNPNGNAYKYYGQRGIKITSAWDDFESFLSDMGAPGEGMSLDRIDVDGNYCLENCRWADCKTQARNRRKGFRKLTMDDAEKIRALYAAGSISQQKIANIYGVTQVLISCITTGKNWL